MSFVDLMADDVWAEPDIVRRTEAMIRSEFSLEAETILNRKVSGMALGLYAPTIEEQFEMARYQAVVEDAHMEGNLARTDMALLLQVFPLEAAQRRLDRMALQSAWDRLQVPEIEPVPDEDTGEVTNAEEVENDKAERAAAEAAVAPHLIEDEDGRRILDPEAAATDHAERLAAQAVIDAAAPDVASLFDLRKAHRAAG